ncbi:MAG: xanthine dehydrogenase family protein molybdopterin-binding subunit [Roseiflexaceae bacterium]
MTQQDSNYQFLGKGRKAIDGMEKITGKARYVGDLTLPGMLHARPVLSPYAHAKIVSIDAAAARQMPGVVAVLAFDDLSTKDRAINSRHSAVLARDKVYFRGQPVVVVVAESEGAARDAADAVDINYEPLTPVVDLLAAAADDAPVIWPNGLPKEGVDMTAAHAQVDKETVEKERAPSNVHAENHFARGNVEQAWRDSDVVIERTYKTPIVHQTYLEPCAVLAEPDVRGGLTLYVSTQGQFSVRDEVARLLSLPKSKVKVVPMTVGGGFGAKYGIIEALVAAAAVKLGVPVRMVLTRSEDFLTTTPAPAAVIAIKTGAKKDGTITAIQAHVTMDNGVFPFTLGGIVGILLGGYYKCANVKIDCFEVFTNKPQAGAYRAPGAQSATFALESNIDDMARELGLDPLEFRYQNAVEGGDLMGNGDPWPTLGLKECLERMREHPAWKDRQPGEGVGIAVGGWPVGATPAAAVCRVDDDGTVRVHVGSVDISGVNSSYVLVAAEILGVSPDQVEIIQGDTQTGPYAGPSGGSQTTYSVSGAVANAAREVRRKLLNLAADHFEASVEDLEIKDGQVQVKGVPARAVAIGELAGIAQGKKAGPGPIVGEGTAAVETGTAGFVVHLAKVAVDPDTGQITPLQYVAIQDVGFALNPLMVTGQIQGGTVQGIGWGLHEAMVYDENGQLLTGSFMDYDIPKIDTVPNVETILVQVPSPNGPFGARGIGEPPFTAGPAALANAVRDAVGVRVTETPMRPEQLWRAMNNGH